MAITKPPVLPSWAEAGDKVQPSNAEIQAGWPLSSIPPSRQRFNWLLNFLANGIRYFSRRGLPDYDAAEIYMIGDRIIGDDGKTYRSLVDNNTGQTPSAQPTKWEEWAPSLSRLADLLQKQTYTAFTTAGAAPNFTLTPTPAITAYAAGQRFRVKFHAAGNGADVLNVSGLGNKPLKQYDSSGAKVAAVIAANQLTDVEYDGVDMVVMDPLPTAALPSGAVIYVAQVSAPSGFLKANGAAVSRTTYSALFAAIGTTFGVGDGATTFNLPDLRAEFIRGLDDGRGIDTSRALGSAQIDSFQGHWHNLTYTAASSIGSGGNSYIQQTISNNNAGPVADTVRAPISDGTNGTPRTSTETRPRNLALLACIKY